MPRLHHAAERLVAVLPVKTGASGQLPLGWGLWRHEGVGIRFQAQRLAVRSRARGGFLIKWGL